MKWEDVTFKDLALEADISVSDGNKLAQANLTDMGLGHFYWWRDVALKMTWVMPGKYEDERLLCSSLRYNMSSDSHDSSCIDAWLKSNLADQFEDSRKAYALRHNEGVISMLRRNNYPLL